MQTSPEMLQRMSDIDAPKIDWEQEHAHLHAVVDHLESQRFLTIEEEGRLKTVKKQKLRAKDRLILLGRLR